MLRTKLFLRGFSTKMNFLSTEKEIEEKIHWALTHGVSMKAKIPTSETNIMWHAPFSLEPYKFPKRSFEKALILAPIFNELIDVVSRDDVWLEETLKTTAIGDPFTKRLLEIHRIVMKEGIRQKATFSINRSDYMQHFVEGDSRDLLQVEINTIAASFASLSTRITDLHRLYSPKSSVPLSSEANASLTLPGSTNAGPELSVPRNSALRNLAFALSEAHREYLRQHQLANPQSSASSLDYHVLFVVQPGEGNFSDQRLLEFELLEGFSVRCLRVTLKEIHQHARISEEGELLFEGLPVSVVYFRSGYGPGDYSEDPSTPPSPPDSEAGPGSSLWSEEWQARLLVERSMAIKCPNIQYHLTGTKKVQQALAEPGVLERFLPSPSPSNERKVSLLREVFAGLYSLDYHQSSESTRTPLLSLEALREKVAAQPGGFVLKPQREGGGNNYFGEEMVSMLGSLPLDELGSFILMERIQPPAQHARLLRQGHEIQSDCLCELGVYGVYLSTPSSEVLLNGAAGHLLRVKPTTANEGGVAAGFAVLSSPDLI